MGKNNKTRRRIEELEILNLGESDPHPATYAPELLQSFSNKNKEDQWVSFICPEFTSLCPKTGWPDFATITINYIADELMLESKSCKLYLFSFRNHGDFHEDCIQTICSDLEKLLHPRYLEVVGEFTPRGGIRIYPFASCCNGEEKYLEIKKKRFTEYAPGKYGLFSQK